jgi:CheY-like chemotaxis protein
MDNVRRVLLVSENPAVAKSLEEALSAKGIGLAVLPTAEEALWMLEDESFDAVLAQAVLRGMSGLELAEELGGRGAGLPVFLVADGPGAAGTGRPGAVAGTLPPPLTPDKLAGFAEQVLSTARPAKAEALQASGQAAPKPASRLRNIVLFLLGPIFALGYIIAFPVVGLGMLVFSLFEARDASPQAAEPPPSAGPRPGLLKALGSMVGVGALGVFYGLVAPFLGMVLVVWFALEAWGRTGARAIGSGKG